MNFTSCKNGAAMAIMTTKRRYLAFRAPGESIKRDLRLDGGKER
jgi:hypothetical protein